MARAFPGLKFRAFTFGESLRLVHDGMPKKQVDLLAADIPYFMEENVADVCTLATRLRLRVVHAAIVLLSTFVFALFSGCSTEVRKSDDGKRILVTTTGMIADIARRLVGDEFQIVQLMGDGVDPHLYKPTRDDLVQLIRADVVLYNGLMLEGKMQTVLNRLGEIERVFAVCDEIPEDVLFGGEDHHPDPHVWMDVTLWRSATQRMSDAICLAYPEMAEKVQQREDELVAELAGLHEYGQNSIASIPASQRILITSHDAFQYFGRAYGLEIQAIQGISTESEAGLQRINEIVDLIVERNLPAVFIESSVPRDTIDAVVQGAAARGHQVQIGGELFSDALGSTGTYEGTYIGMLDHNFTTVARALGGNVPPRGWKDQLSEHPEP